MRILLLLTACLLVAACASSNPRPATSTPQPATRTVQAAPTTTYAPAPDARPQGTTDPGTRWMPIQARGALAAETEPRPPSSFPAPVVRQPSVVQPSTRQPSTRQPSHERPALMPGTPPGTPEQWTTPPRGPSALGDPPAGTGLPRR